jgi:hypothetical protein
MPIFPLDLQDKDLPVGLADLQEQPDKVYHLTQMVRHLQMEVDRVFTQTGWEWWQEVDKKEFQRKKYVVNW